MNALQTAIREKRNILRGVYGGMMSLSDLSREMGMNREAARSWAAANGIGNLTSRRVKYETDEVAKLIVLGRGMT